MITAAAAGGIGGPLEVVVPALDLDTVFRAGTIIRVGIAGRVPAGIHIGAQTQHLDITDLIAADDEAVQVIGDLGRNDRVLITGVVIAVGIRFVILDVPIIVAVAVIGVHPDVGAGAVPIGKISHIDVDRFLVVKVGVTYFCRNTGDRERHDRYDHDHSQGQCEHVYKRFLALAFLLTKPFAFRSEYNYHLPFIRFFPQTNNASTLRRLLPLSGNRLRIFIGHSQKSKKICNNQQKPKYIILDYNQVLLPI